MFYQVADNIDSLLEEMKDKLLPESEVELYGIPVNPNEQIIIYKRIKFYKLNYFGIDSNRLRIKYYLLKYRIENLKTDLTLKDLKLTDWVNIFFSEKYYEANYSSYCDKKNRLTYKDFNEVINNFKISSEKEIVKLYNDYLNDLKKLRISIAPKKTTNNKECTDNKYEETKNNKVVELKDDKSYEMISSIIEKIGSLLECETEAEMELDNFKKNIVAGDSIYVQCYTTDVLERIMEIYFSIFILSSLRDKIFTYLIFFNFLLKPISLLKDTDIQEILNLSYEYNFNIPVSNSLENLKDKEYEIFEKKLYDKLNLKLSYIEKGVIEKIYLYLFINKNDEEIETFLSLNKNSWFKNIKTYILNDKNKIKKYDEFSYMFFSKLKFQENINSMEYFSQNNLIRIYLLHKFLFLNMINPIVEKLELKTKPYKQLSGERYFDYKNFNMILTKLKNNDLTALNISKKDILNLESQYILYNKFYEFSMQLLNCQKEKEDLLYTSTLEKIYYKTEELYNKITKFGTKYDNIASFSIYENTIENIKKLNLNSVYCIEEKYDFDLLIFIGKNEEKIYFRDVNNDNIKEYNIKNIEITFKIYPIKNIEFKEKDTKVSSNIFDIL